MNAVTKNQKPADLWRKHRVLTSSGVDELVGEACDLEAPIIDGEVKTFDDLIAQAELMVLYMENFATHADLRDLRLAKVLRDGIVALAEHSPPISRADPVSKPSPENRDEEAERSDVLPALQLAIDMIKALPGQSPLCGNTVVHRLQEAIDRALVVGSADNHAETFAGMMARYREAFLAGDGDLCGAVEDEMLRLPIESQEDAACAAELLALQLDGSELYGDNRDELLANRLAIRLKEHTIN